MCLMRTINIRKLETLLRIQINQQLRLIVENMSTNDILLKKNAKKDEKT